MIFYRKEQEVGDLRSEPRSSSQHHAKFSGHKFCESGDIILSIRYVTNRRSYDFNRCCLSWQVKILPSLVRTVLLQMEI